MADKATEAANTVPEKDDGGWTNHTGTFFKFEEKGDVIQGVLCSRGTIEISGADVMTYTVEKPDHSRVKFLGGVSLDLQMADVPEGKEIKLIYQGKETTKASRTVKIFELYTR